MLKADQEEGGRGAVVQVLEEEEDVVQGLNAGLGLRVVRVAQAWRVPDADSEELIAVVVEVQVKDAQEVGHALVVVAQEEDGGQV